MRKRKLLIKVISAGLAAGFLSLTRPGSQPGMGVTALIGIAFYVVNQSALSMLFPERQYLTVPPIGDRYNLHRWAKTKVGE